MMPSSGRRTARAAASTWFSAILLLALIAFDNVTGSRYHQIAVGDGVGHGRFADSHVLGDLIVVASVEGGLYGLDRETGRTKWSLPPFTTTSNEMNETVAFGPLVGTTYGPKHRSFTDLASDMPLIDAPDAWDGESPYDGRSGKEALDTLQDLGLYIVEPTSGQVYLLNAVGAASSQHGAAQDRTRARVSKLPLTLPQLVDLSPFSFPGDTSRVFVGHKSTSLVEIDVKTGRLGAVFGGGSQGRRGVWCRSPTNATSSNPSGPGGEEEEARCADDRSSSTEWAYVGRNDYTLSIHMRGRPALSQTLTFSTFVPNAADRDLAASWYSQERSPDHRIFMAMPEEKSIVCFNSTMRARSPREQQDRTLWISELDATVAGVMDVLFTSGLSALDEKRPLLVPHPASSLEALFGDNMLMDRSTATSEEALQKMRPAYVGVSNGLLYVLSSEQFPLVAFSPRAPASLDPNSDNGYGGHRSASSCASHGCLLGSYELGRSNREGAETEELLGLGPGHAPLLGIDDGSNDRKKDERGGQPSSQSKPEDSAKVKSSSWFTPSMIASQIVILLLLACLCGLVYVGGQELRRQQAEEAKAASRHLTFSAVPEQVAKQESPAEGATQGATVTLSSEQSPPQPNGEAEIAKTSPVEAEASGIEIIPSEKKKVKRRRRGKRGGVAVAQREGAREGEERGEEDDSGQEEGADFVLKDTAKESITATSLDETPSSPLKEVTGASSAIASASTSAVASNTTVEEAVHANGTSAVLNAEGGGQVAIEDGQKAAVRGQDKSLIISEEILGYGSSGTVVFKGTFQGRAVAVKRLLRDFVDVAAKEVSLLESADNHANVIRYYYKETTGNFLFIALELCPASLSDIIEKPRDFVELSAALKPKRALSQIASGLQHLHSLSIVHRDIKPQNILVSRGANGQLKMLLSDFGLSKRLDGAAQTSFSQTVNNPGGTFGWRAPEILSGEVSIDTGTGSNRDSSTNSSLVGVSLSEDRKRLTRAVDIFALGCVTYYVLSNGDHPFGSRYEREMNIMKGVRDLSRLDGLGEEGHEAQHLIQSMVSYESGRRPSATEVLSHPFFWDAGRRLAFLQDTSDRFDIMERDPPASPLLALERDAAAIIGTDWHRRVDKAVMEDLNRRRSYDQASVAALLRAIRNKKHHIHDIPPQVRRIFTAAGTLRGSHGKTGSSSGPALLDGGPSSGVPLLPDSFLAYFTTRFPRLFLHTYEVVDSFNVLKTEVVFAPYFRPVLEGD